ncbi:uncharacterized protein O3Q21_014091 [Podargus strigoides]
MRAPLLAARVREGPGCGRELPGGSVRALRRQLVRLVRRCSLPRTARRRFTYQQLWKRNEFVYKYHCVASMNMHPLEEMATSQLSVAVAEGFEAQIAGLIEMFLVELYRWKLCQFSSSIKSKIRTHLAYVHETNTAVLKWTKMKMSHTAWEMKLTKKIKKTK